jgi:hypothetical protein
LGNPPYHPDMATDYAAVVLYSQLCGEPVFLLCFFLLNKLKINFALGSAFWRTQLRDIHLLERG